MTAIVFVVILTVAIGIISVIFSRISQKQRVLLHLKTSFGEIPKEREDVLYKIAVYHEEVKELTNEFMIDEVTWNDLDMDDIFWRINNTKSYIGEQVLYHHLHLLEIESEQIKVSEHRRQYLLDNEDKRVALEYELAKIGKGKDNFYLPSFLTHAIDFVPGNILTFQILQLTLVLTAVLGFGNLILFQKSTYIGIFIINVVVNLIVYSLSKLKYETYLNAISSIGRLLTFTGNLQKKKVLRDFFEFDTNDEMKVCLKSLKKLEIMSSGLMIKKNSAFTGDPFDVVRDYVIGATLWDFTAYIKIIRMIQMHQKELLQVYEYIGRLDMDVAVASFQDSLPSFAKPEFTQGKEVEVISLYHPLLHDPIANDFTLEKNCVITGSNASGKSTFLKSLAINIILAQSINICTAQSMKLPKMHVMTSMTVSDDILSGESYYMKEINYLKRMVDETKKGIFTLYISDEILRGTNAKERLAASLAVLSFLEEKNARLIVATHDKNIADALKERYQCCSFGNYIKDEQIVFDYKIHEGFLETKNAIVLLKSAGFPQEVVERARRLDEIDH